VKCDESPGACLNCERLNLECKKVDGTSATPTKVEDARASLVSETSLGEVGVKRKRTFRSCIQCRASKARCSGGRPACSRCVQRAVPCIYEEDSIPQWTRVVQSVGQSDPQTDASTSESSNPKEHHDATRSRHVSKSAPVQPSPASMSVEHSEPSQLVPDLQLPSARPPYPLRASSSLGVFATDEGPDSLEW